MVEGPLLMEELQVVPGYFQLEVELLGETVVLVFHPMSIFDKSIFQEQFFEQ